jgi:hypothetical protein
MNVWKWENHGRGEWRGTHGAGAYKVVYSPRGKKWFAMTDPFMGTPTVFDAFKTRREAQRWIEESFRGHG